MIRVGLVVVLGWAAALPGAMITGNDKGGEPVEDPPYTVSLTPRPVQHLGTGDNNLSSIYDADLKLINNTFANFPSVKGGGDATGTFNILQYEPWILDTHLGGADFSVLYNDGVDKPRTDYDWIQIAHYHNWGDHGSGDSVDTQPGSAFPFYYAPSKLPTLKVSSFASPGQTGSIWEDKTNYPDQNIQNPAGGGNVPAGDLLFVDQPYCKLSCADADGKAYAYFDLFLVTFTWNQMLGQQAGGTATVLDGVRWGVEITKAPQQPDNPGSIPEPGTYWLMAGGLILLGRLRTVPDKSSQTASAGVKLGVPRGIRIRKFG